MIHFYQIEGNWPEILVALGISNSTFLGSESIDIVTFEPDGSIVAALKTSPGANKSLTLQPQIDDTNVARRNCSDNFGQNELPETCRTR